jgi:hypothetical protein
MTASDVIRSVNELAKLLPLSSEFATAVFPATVADVAADRA